MLRIFLDSALMDSGAASESKKVSISCLTSVPLVGFAFPQGSSTLTKALRGYAIADLAYG